MNLAPLTISTMLMLVVIAGCSAFDNAAIVYTHLTKRPEMFSADLSRCEGGGEQYAPRGNLLHHLVMEFVHKEHVFSVETANCLETLGWRPSLELLFHYSRTMAELEADFYACCKDTRYEKVYFSGISLYNILTSKTSSLDKKVIRDCLDEHGWKVHDPHPPESDDDYGLILPVPLLPMIENKKYHKKGSVLEATDLTVSWAIECPLFINTQTWEDANKIIENLNSMRFGGYDNWRLPTMTELSYLQNIVAVHATPDPLTGLKQVGFECIKDGMYWTSTPAGNDLIWGINLVTRKVQMLGTTSVSRGLVMPVRRGAW